MDKVKFLTGEFRNPIIVQEVKELKNAENIITDTYVDVLKTRAKVTNKKGEEIVEATGTTIKIYKTFYIRYSRAVNITATNVIKYKGDIYNIVFVNNINDLDKYLEIRCEKHG